MNKIFAVSNKEFNDIFEEKRIKNPSLWAFISIQEPEPQQSMTYRFHETTHDVLVTEFYDISAPVLHHEVWLQPMSMTEAQRIVNFVERNKHRNFLVHCTAGICRSGAVTTFIHEYLTEKGKEYCIEDKAFNLYNPHILPNIHVLNSLREQAQIGHYNPKL